MCTAVLLAAVLTSSVCAEWTTPVPVASGINTQFAEWTPYLSYDGQSLYFTRGYTSDDFYFHVYEAKRSQPAGPFTSVSKVYSPSYHAFGPWVSPDNLRMYYWHELPSDWRVEVSQRASVNDPWSEGTPINLGSVANPCAPSLSSDELTMVFNTPSGPGGWDMYLATRPNINLPFDNIRSLTELNTAGADGRPFLSPDALSIYWNNGEHILEATRSSLSDPFGNTQILSALDMPGRVNGHPAISSDGTAIYFTSSLSGQPSDIYVSYNVPEPATLLLFGLGAVMFIRKREKSL